MLAIVFYSVASLLLPVIIINAKEPVMDFSQLIPPTATTITIFPPAPVPAPAAGVGNSSPPSSPSHHQDMGIVYMTSQSKFSSFLDSILPTKKNSHRSLFSLSSYRRAWRLSLKRSSTVTSHRAATRMVVEEKPYKSRYSPRAASSMEEYDAYGFRQSISYNKSGSCSKVQTEQHSQQHDVHQQQQQQRQQPQDDHFHAHDLEDWRTPMQHIALPGKP